MPDQLPTGDMAVYIFFEMIALAFAFASVESLMGNKPWFVWSGCLILTVLFLLAGIKWPRIKSKVGARFATSVDQIANSSRYQWGLGLFLLGCIGVYGIVHIHSLHNDLDTYVMPRILTKEQSDDLRKYLSNHEAHAVAVRVNVRDREALEYASQIFNALKLADWDVTFDPSETSDGTPNTLTDGLGISVAGSNVGPPDPKRDPQPLLQNALKAAHVDCSGIGGIAAGEYKLFLLVGHRPLRLGHQRPTLYKLSQWIEQLNQ
jgi:hypothetical protein